MTLLASKLIELPPYYTFMILLKGVSYLKSNKISRFLFSQLAKYGILIRHRLVKINGAIDEKNMGNVTKYHFFLTDVIAIQEFIPVSWMKHIRSKFLLVYDTKNVFVELIEKFGFIPILAYPLRISFIARQILNHFEALNTAIHYNKLALKDSLTDTLRVVINNRSYFTVTFLPDLGYLEYRGATIKLSKREREIIERLAYNFKESANPCVRFPNIKNKDLANSVSRLRSKFNSIGLPLVIRNQYGKGYCLEPINK